MLKYNDKYLTYFHYLLHCLGYIETQYGEWHTDNYIAEGARCKQCHHIDYISLIRRDSKLLLYKYGWINE